MPKIPKREPDNKLHLVQRYIADVWQEKDYYVASINNGVDCITYAYKGDWKKVSEKEKEQIKQAIILEVFNHFINSNIPPTTPNQP